MIFIRDVSFQNHEKRIDHDVTAQVPAQYQIDFRSDLNTEKDRVAVKSIKDPCLKIKMNNP